MKTVTYSDADLKRLADGGWKETEANSGMWIRPEMNARYGGNSTGEALRKQDKLDIIAKYGAFFYAQPCRYGFGYWLGVYENNLEKPKRYGHPFDHLDKETADKLVKRFNSEKNYEAILGLDYQPQKFEIIVVFKEKHGERHFIVHTMQELEKVALKIVLERNEEGWYSFEYKQPAEPKMTVEDAKKLEMSSVVAAVEREWSDYKYSKKQYEEGVRLKAALDKIVKDKDGEIALQFLNSMKSGEYEAFEIIKSEPLE